MLNTCCSIKHIYLLRLIPCSSRLLSRSSCLRQECCLARVVELTEVRNKIRQCANSRRRYAADFGDMPLPISGRCPFLPYFGDDVLPGPHFLYAI